MGSIQDEWAADAVEILGEIPKAVSVHKGTGAPVSFNCLMGPPMVSQDLETGGFLNSTSFDVKFLRPEIEANPGVVVYGSIVNFTGKLYRIVAVDDRPPSAWVIFRVQSKGEPA